MSKQKKVDVSVFNWGPCVVKMKIMDEFKKLLFTEGAKNTKDFTTRLAGIIEKKQATVKKQNKKLCLIYLIILVYTTKCLKDFLTNHT